MSIKSLLKKIWLTIQSLFDNFPASVKDAVHVGVTLTQNLKNYVDSPMADILTAIIPGNLDDKIKLALRAGIPIILFNLKLADQCGKSNDPEEITKCAINQLQSMSGEIKSSFLHSFSVLVTQLLSDGKISWSDGVCIVEWYYKQKLK